MAKLIHSFLAAAKSMAPCVAAGLRVSVTSTGISTAESSDGWIWVANGGEDRHPTSMAMAAMVEAMATAGPARQCVFAGQPGFICQIFCQ